MDRALWLLLWLRFRGWLRRLRRLLSTLKGIVLAIVFGLLASMCLVSLLFRTMFANPTSQRVSLESVREYGPLALLLYCAAVLGLSSSEGIISFAPAEINLLFPGPFSRRQLLAYKLLSSLVQTLIGGIFMSLIVLNYTAGYGTAYVGLVLVMMFMQLLAMAVSLLAATIGAMAYSRARRIGLGILGLLAVFALWQQGDDLFAADFEALALRLNQAPAFAVILWPFRCYVNVLTAESFWPDLCTWAATGLAINACLLGMVFALDAQYLESAASASERTYARLQRLRAGGMAMHWTSTGNKVRWRLPTFPWWGGVGPLAWRQAIAAMRGFRGLILFLVIFGAFTIVPAFMQVRTGPGSAGGNASVYPLLAMMFFMMPAVMMFDFRSDLDRMEVLKSLPIHPRYLVVGQVVTPALLAGFLQAVILLIVLGLLQETWGIFFTAAIFMLPLNFLLFGLENLFFLIMPTRLPASTPGDMQLMGRFMLQMSLKMLTLTFIVGTCALLGYVAFALLDDNKVAGLTTAWLMLAGMVCALIPPLAIAFQKFDVARDIPP